MAKARRQIKESLSLVDAICEIVDARIPESSRNPELSDILSGKPRIVLMNKSDLADERATKQWLRYYRENGCVALALDCRSGHNVNLFLPAVRELLKEKIEKNREKGLENLPLRLMVVGIPNTGKSSFINRLTRKARAAVADKPGVTRQNSWFTADGGIELLDTPGVLWPKFEDPEVADKLAFIGSVKDTVFDCEALCIRLLAVLVKEYPDRLTTRYKIENFAEMPAYDVLALIGQKRGMRVSGGGIDTERAANVVLDEYRAGKLGRITLERPPA